MDRLFRIPGSCTQGPTWATRDPKKPLKKHERMCITYNDITFTNTRMSRTVLRNLYYSRFETLSSN